MTDEPTPSGRAPRRAGRLSRELITEVTLEIIDTEGVGAASMRAIASRLGVEAMSLYKHFATRDALLDAVVDRIVDELDDDPEVRREAIDGWRDYLARLARGVRRYAIAHPHAFPLVTTRPADAPWVNPPLRSLPWIESLLTTLSAEGFDDDEVLFAYRSFNSFLLGYLLLESGARTLRDPQDGDGSFAAGDGTDPEPVPGGLSPTRTPAQTEDIADAETPAIHRLARGLAEDHFGDEFERAMTEMLDGIAGRLA